MRRDQNNLTLEEKAMDKPFWRGELLAQFIGMGSMGSALNSPVTEPIRNLRIIPDGSAIDALIMNAYAKVTKNDGSVDDLILEINKVFAMHPGQTLFGCTKEQFIAELRGVCQDDGTRNSADAHRIQGS